MDDIAISFGVVMLLQITVGIIVNVILLLFYIRMVSISPVVSSSDLIFSHLTLANTIILLSIGIPETMSAWGQRNFLDDIGCKILMYLYRVARGLAICTTCLLSVFQAITISPGTSRWARIKAKLPKCIIPSCLLSWILNLLIELSMPIHMKGPQNSSLVRIMLDLKYCTKVGVSTESTLVITVVLSLRDLFFVLLMSVASGYIVFILYRHHQRVLHLHGPGRSPGEMPEVRAAKRVIALVALYILFYVRQSIMLSVIFSVKEKSSLLVNCQMMLGFAFPVICPFLIIHSDRRIKAICFQGRFSIDS
ncbi:vomeronasal 1 receptor ornAnaV1R3246 [Ornithorhynchus anatinus]|uniref:vomeronasal 1 receptor ornAnaV1R3246 n=1 Tax=Ornithorhynchus anatinus TaxID=9258 RepID=UPI0002240172|nr:vomeronasal 1 receptor ornAnaV1R3246 [Ornithorhynchus anatinus]